MLYPSVLAGFQALFVQRQIQSLRVDVKEEFKDLKANLQAFTSETRDGMNNFTRDMHEMRKRLA